MTQSTATSRLFSAGIFVALAGSVWAMLSQGSCGSCERATDLVSGINLGLIGAVFYGIILALSVLVPRGGNERQPLRLGVGLAIALAAGVHAALVLFLLRNRIVCPPCLVTAAGAWLAAGVLLLSGANRKPVVGLVLASAVSSYFVVRVLKPSDEFWKHRAAIKIAQKVKQEKGTPPAGQVTLTAYVRPGCHRCDLFEKEVLPHVRRQFPKEVAIDVRPAPNNINTPTVVILGARDTIFDSLLSREDVLAATRAALGKPAEGQLIGTGIELKPTRYNE